MQAQTTQSAEVNRTFVIDEKDFERYHLEVLKLIQLVKGYFVTDEIQMFLSQHTPEGTDEDVIMGFYNALDFFTNDAEENLRKLYTSHRLLCNAERADTITPEELIEMAKRIKSEAQ